MVYFCCWLGNRTAPGPFRYFTYPGYAKMFDCCTQRNKKGIRLSTRTVKKRPLTPHHQQHQELIQRWANDRASAPKKLDPSALRNWSTLQTSASVTELDTYDEETHTTTFSCLSTCTTEKTPRSSRTGSPIRKIPSIASSSLPNSPSSLQRKRKSEPVAVPVQAISCDNFECMTCEVQNENWTVARLSARIFRFCSQECWTIWLDNPGHLGSWSSPLLSYHSSPEMEPRASRDSYMDSPLMTELAGGSKTHHQTKPLVYPDLPPLMI